MGSTAGFADWVADQFARTPAAGALGEISTRHMFGEYCVYLAGRVVAIICDDTVFVKQIPAIAEVMEGAKATADHPFEGSRLHWILDVEDLELVDEVLPELYAAANPPKKKPKFRPGTDLPWGIGAPAAGALAAEGITTLAQLTEYSEEDIRALHGMGPKAIQVLRDSLVKQDLSFREE